MNVKRAAEILAETFPSLGVEADAGWGEGVIFLGSAAEGAEIDDLPAANYYGGFEDPEEKIWVLGVHKKLAEKLDELGYYADWHDPGTLLAFEK